MWLRSHLPALSSATRKVRGSRRRRCIAGASSRAVAMLEDGHMFSTRAAMAQPPTFEDIVDRFTVEILKRPGDLVAVNGDIASTKWGDLMLNDPVYSAMFRLVQHWRFNAPTLQPLFELVVGTKARRKELDDSMNRVFAHQHFDPSAASPLTPDDRSIAQYHELNDEIGATEVAASTYAATVVLLLADLLSRLKDDIDATEDDWEKVGPLFGGYSIGAILTAAANNFRHRDEWVKTLVKDGVPTAQQLPSIRILGAALQEPIAPDGARHGLSRDVCPDVLELLSGCSFDALGAQFFAFANALVQRVERTKGGA